MQFKVQPLTYQQLDQIASPRDPQQPEAIPFVLFDTLNLLAAGVQSLTFFQQNSSDRTLTNVSGGQLAQGFRFRIYAYGLDVLREPSAGAGTTAGVLTDVARIVKTNRGTWTFNKSQKTYGPIPLSFCHASGGETGFLAATLTAPANLQFANNGVFSGGFSTDGAIIITDKEPFDVTINFATPFTALSADALLRAYLRGVLYRPVR